VRCSDSQLSAPRQSRTTALVGTVQDTTGAVLPGVTISVSSPQQIGGVQTSVTDSQGLYRFPALKPGVYEMEVTLPGFKTVKRSGITLDSRHDGHHRRLAWPSRP
jgi:protocatechuate 3,4-dioxygenase beta subunit